jgi:hypothetical protein
MTTGSVMNFKGARFARQIILTRLRGYVAYPLSHRVRPILGFKTDQSA